LHSMNVDFTDFTDEEMQRFEKRLEEGYDILDERYSAPNRN